MASTILSKPGLEVSRLQPLVTGFENAVCRGGDIFIDDTIWRSVHRYQAQGPQYNATELDPVVRILEQSSPELYKRLFGVSLADTCEVLIHSETCLAQRRGFYLLSDALHTNVAQLESRTVVRDKMEKKIVIGSKVLITLIEGFGASENDDQTRRWMGVLALELLKHCPENVAVLANEPDKLPLLNSTIENGPCQVIKLLAGSMIRILLEHEVNANLIWPDKWLWSTFDRFPRGQEQDTQWINDYEDWIEEIYQRGVLNEDKSSVIFAYAVFIGELRYSTDVLSAIFITLSENLNIVVPESTAGPATYIDVPLPSINSITIESYTNSQSQSLSYVINIRLSNSTQSTCYLNASAKNYPLVAIAFSSEDDAKYIQKAIEKAIEPRLLNRAASARVSMSEGISVSQPVHDSESDPQSTQDSQDLVQTTAQIAWFVAKSPTPPSHRPTTQGYGPAINYPAGAYSGILFGKANRDLHNTSKTQGMRGRTSIAFGVDVTQKDPTHDTETSQGLHLSSSHEESAEKDDLPPQLSSISPNEKMEFAVSNLDGHSDHNEISAEHSTTETPSALNPIQSTEAPRVNEYNHQTEKPSTMKVIERLRKSEGNIQEPSVESQGGPSITENTQQASKAKKFVKDKRMTSSKTISGVQKQARSAKNATIPLQTTKALEQKAGETIDEYEVQASPPSPQSYVTARTIEKDKNRSRDEAASKVQSNRNASSITKVSSHESVDDKDVQTEPAVDEGHDVDETPVGNTKAQKASATLKISKAKAKSAPAPPTRARPTREAAKKANAKMQGAEHSTTMGDTEDAHFQEAIGHISGEAILEGDMKSSPADISNVRVSPRGNKGQNARAFGEQKIAETAHEDAKGEDPFNSRLGHLTSPVKATSRNTKQAKTKDTKRVSKIEPNANIKFSGKAGKQPNHTKTNAKQTSKLPSATEQDIQSSDVVPGMKRKPIEEVEKQTKKVKLTTQAEPLIPSKGEQADGPAPKTPMPAIGKKPALIHWDASGPRNQGSASTKKARFSHDVQTDDADGVGLREQPDLKRKLDYSDDELAPLENDQPTKRQKQGPITQDPITPSPSRVRKSRKSAKPPSSIRQENPDRLSSQSSKVDVNGSPLALEQPSTQDEETGDRVDETTLVFNDDQLLGNDEEHDTSESQNNAVKGNVLLKDRDGKIAPVTANRKQAPSSPLAPSVLEKHIELGNGQMVHAEKSTETVVPTETQNPFGEGIEKAPSSFARLLRKSDTSEMQRENDEIVGEKSARGKKRKAADHDDDDPDKTLVEPDLEVEPKPKRQKAQRATKVQFSSTTASSSQDVSSGVSSIEQQSETESNLELRKWQETLEPDQATMLDILTVCVHKLVRNLVDQETVAKDVINDYKMRGGNLLKAYKQERDNILKKDLGELNRVKESLSLIYLQAQETAREASEKSNKLRKSDRFEARQKEQNEIRLKAIDELLKNMVEKTLDN